MEVSTIITSAITMITALGGLEFLKWLWTRKSKARLAAAEANAAELKAEKDEYYLLRERLQFMNEQIIAKDKRYDEQTEFLRGIQMKLNEQITENGLLKAELAELKAERAMKLCQVRNCPNREPQSGY